MFDSTRAFVIDLFKFRSIILELAKRDFQQQYMGSYLGIIWVFLQPTLYVLVLYVIFSLGFRVGFTEEIPFSLYLITGIVCWFFFSENLSAACHVIKSHTFLVKKVDFRLSVLPIVKLLANLLPHSVLVLSVMLVAWYQGYPPTIYTLQLFYYLLCMSGLLIGLGWITSSTRIFISDVSKIVAIVIQFGFWLTPIFWHISMIPNQFHWIVKLNPVNYIVNGYRDSLISKIPFWERIGETVYFWSFTVIVLFIGINVYRKLKPHFAEVV